MVPVVVGVGSGDESVICRIVGRGVEYPVHFYEACFLVKLILDLATFANLDNCIEIVRAYSFRAYVMPDIFHKSNS